MSSPLPDLHTFEFIGEDEAMSYEQHQNDELTMDVCLSPGLEVAIRNWRKARLAFQDRREKENQDCYMLRSDELGLAIGSWVRTEPELGYQFGLWFKSHEEDWAI
jgi:hypothetical protein